RIQCVHNLAGYYRMILLDHRNVLLDDPILDFLARVPGRLRVNKELYMKTVSAMYPALWSLPIASCSLLEDWAHEMIINSSLRRYLLKQLNDIHSGIWDYFDRRAVVNFFNSVLSSSESKPTLSYITVYLESSAKVM